MRRQWQHDGNIETKINGNLNLQFSSNANKFYLYFRDTQRSGKCVVCSVSPPMSSVLHNNMPWKWSEWLSQCEYVGGRTKRGGIEERITALGGCVRCSHYHSRTPKRYSNHLMHLWREPFPGVISFNATLGNAPYVPLIRRMLYSWIVM